MTEDSTHDPAGAGSPAPAVPSPRPEPTTDAARPASVDVVPPAARTELDRIRRRWADLLAWTAFLLSRSDEHERWLDFYAAARALVEGRGVGDIPVMRYVARQTVEALRQRQLWR